MALTATAGAWPACVATFTPLGDLAGGTFASYANDVSADGNVVVGYSFAASGYEAFRWTAETGIVSLGGPSTSAAAVSADGRVVVGFHKDGAEAMRWTAETGIIGLGHLAQGSLASQAQDVSADGSVVVGYDASGGAFRWTAETGMVGIGGSAACCISADGQVIAGTISTFSTNEGFRWTPDKGLVPLGDLPGGNDDTVVRGISDDGEIIVGTGRSGKEPLITEAFRWTAKSGMVGLGALREDTFESTANDASLDGSIIVGDNIATSFVRDEAFIWSETGGMRSLQELLVNDYGVGDSVNGWMLERAHAITPDGLTIVGFGTNPDGQEEAWRVQFVIPEPPTFALLLIGFAVTLACSPTRAGWPTTAGSELS
jgi:probable HAF family extracellular repeat protein